MATTREKTDEIYRIKQAIQRELRFKGYTEEEIGKKLSNLPKLIESLQVNAIHGDVPQWFKESVVCWYDPSRQHLTNDEIKAGNGQFFLQDFSGNGLDMTMHNFQGEGMSGMDGYATNFNDWDKYSKFVNIEIKHNYFIITSKKSSFASFNVLKTNIINKESTNIIIEGITEGYSFDYEYYDINGLLKTIKLKNGENILPLTASNDKLYGFAIHNWDTISKINVKVTQLPLYPNALVFDGVDDYGISENQPKLSDYTVIAKRKWIDFKKTRIFCQKSRVDGGATFFIESYKDNNVMLHMSFGAMTDVPISNLSPKIFVQTPKKYNNYPLNKGIESDNGDILKIGHRANYSYFQGALYQFLLFNRTLTQDELDYVKYVVMKEPLPEPIAVYSAKGRSNDEAADTIHVLPNLAPNGNHDYDIQLNNFNFYSEGNWGGYGTNFSDGWGKYGVNFMTNIVFKDTLVSFSCNKTDVGVSHDISTIYPSIKIKLNKCTANGLRVRNKDGNISYYISSNDINKEFIFNISSSILDDRIYLVSDGIGDIEIELLPQYPDGLYFDGMDDFGVCEKFPKFTPDKGYTVIAKRKIFSFASPISSVVTKRVDGSNLLDSAFMFERQKDTISFGKSNPITLEKKDISFQTKGLYNNAVIDWKHMPDTNVLMLSAFTKSEPTKGCVNMVFYELHIFDHDLTPKEIEMYIQKNIDKDYVLPQPTEQPTE